MNLPEVILPSTITEICNCAFINCKAPVPPECDSNDVFRISRTDGDQYEEIPLYVPRGTADAYRKATGWSVFKTIIEE